MKSNWDLTKARSQYHFDTNRIDPRWDTVINLGTIKPCWQGALKKTMDSAYAVSWRTRGKPNDPLQRPKDEYDQEEYDLDQIGMPRDYKVTDITYTLEPEFQQIVDCFGLGKCMARVHVQKPGQVWNLHLDKLEKWMPEDPSQVGRYMIQLTDWQPGHFWCYGNFQWAGWRAGSVTTFDWINVPHATANAGMNARATLQLTGIITNKTQEFLELLKTQQHAVDVTTLTNSKTTT